MKKTKFKMQINTPNSVPYNTSFLDSEKYKKFFSECKEMKKSKDKDRAAKGDSLMRSYTLFQKYGVPFDIATVIYPQLCKIMGEYCQKFSQIKEQKKNGG